MEAPQISPSPYREIFVEIEALPDCRPGQAYQEYRNFLERHYLDPSIYLSMAITSGGFARDPELSFEEAMNRNGQFAIQVAKQLCSRFDGWVGPEDIVIPSDLGKVPGWNQGDFLVFWSHVITGLDPTEAAQIDAVLEAEQVTQAQGFTDREASEEQKWQDITKLVDRYVDLIFQLELGKKKNGAAWPKNMQAIVLILDEIKSLGVNGERYLAHQLALGEEYVPLRNVPYAYARESKRLEELGASVLPLIGEHEPGHMAGRQNMRRFEQLRGRGVCFRQSGILQGTVFRKQDLAAARRYKFEPPKSSSEAWAEYYEAKDSA